MPLKLDDGLQIGGSSTATQNFTLRTPTPPDGSVALYRGNHGSEGEKVLEIDAQGRFVAKTIHLGEPVAMAGKTFHDFPVPAGVKRITLILDGVSTNGASAVQTQLVTSAGVQTTSYDAVASVGAAPSTYAVASVASGFAEGTGGAAATRFGALVLTRVSDNNTWMMNHSVATTDLARVMDVRGRKVLSSDLLSVRLTTVNGTDQFDAGTVNISWEY